MRAQRRVLLSTALILLAFLLMYSFNLSAQQVYHGDGATNNGNGGWSISGAKSDQCLNCHKPGGSAVDMSSYLMTGHKNVLRKVIPGTPWAGADGSIYQTTDDLYGSGSIYDWIGGTITVGTNPPTVNTNPVNRNPDGSYKYYGTTRNLFYLFGGWADRRQLDTIFDGGFTGEQYPNGTYDCARCHTTGYRFDGNGTEPTYNGAKIPDAQFSRVPTDWDPPSSHTSSWQLDGIQCERCHIAQFGSYNHTATGAFVRGVPTVAVNEDGTALCLGCHREETADTTAHTITPSSGLIVSDGGSCSDGVSPDYASCTASGGNKWNYAPFFDHESGPTFLNSPHARFTGTLTQNTQNSPDLSVKMVGAYNSVFSDPLFPTNNAGCTGCHDPHQSTVSSASPANAFFSNCNDCHALAQGLLTSVRHPTGPGTMFPTSSSADNPGSCVVCHMPQSYHLFRISTNANYSTFPTAAQFNDPTNPQTTPNAAADGIIANAVWADVDLVCGQCHVGSGTITTTPAPGAPIFTKAALAAGARGIHGSAPPPIFSPNPGLYTSPQVVSLNDDEPAAAIYYTTDGSTPTPSSTPYTGPITVATATTIKAIAAVGSLAPSAVVTAAYNIVAAVPTISPMSGSYTSPQSVTITDGSPGVTIYYTVDGSTPSTASKVYTGPITVSTSATIKAMAAGNGYGPSGVSTANYSLVAAPPTFSPVSGSYTKPQAVMLMDATPGVTISYTTDGSYPTTASTVYTAPIIVSTSTMIRAMAMGNGFGPSGVVSSNYSIVAAVPTFSPMSGAYTKPLVVTLADSASGVTIYYTIDGSWPTTASTVYTGPITLSTSTTIKAIAAGNGYGPSGVASANYSVQ